MGRQIAFGRGFTTRVNYPQAVAFFAAQGIRFDPLPPLSGGLPGAALPDGDRGRAAAPAPRGARGALRVGSHAPVRVCRRLPAPRAEPRPLLARGLARIRPRPAPLRGARRLAGGDRPVRLGAGLAAGRLGRWHGAHDGARPGRVPGVVEGGVGGGLPARRRPARGPRRPVRRPLPCRVLRGGPGCRRGGWRVAAFPGRGEVARSRARHLRLRPRPPGPGSRATSPSLGCRSGSLPRTSR